jgi:hypothetical protein
VPHGFFGLDILLPANMAIAALNNRITVKAILLCSFF